MSRSKPGLIVGGDVWDAAVPGVGAHPVVVVTRESAIDVLSSLTCALVTSSFHGHVAEVEVGRDEGLDHALAIALGLG